jgi:Protein of unknown function (DUF3455)
MKSKTETTLETNMRRQTPYLKVIPYLKAKQIFAVALMLTVAALSSAVVPAAGASAPKDSPSLPSPLCDSIRVPEGNKLSHRVYALGVQVYRWNGTAWAFVAPEATLFANANYNGEVGTHYVGPTWESNSGSKVVAARVPGTGCTPDSTAIPWLLLQKVSTEGPGIFHRVTYIQRVNTTGGIAPTAPGSVVGEESEVPYTAEYYFYRAKD